MNDTFDDGTLPQTVAAAVDAVLTFEFLKVPLNWIIVS